MRSVEVTLTWLKFEEGGRRRPVQGAFYSTVAHFPGVVHPELMRSAWSVVLRFSNTSELNPSTAIMRFLMEEAPHEILTEGLEFELLEGQQVVATGKVISVISPLQ